jgi:hypothetical protein
LQSSQSLALIDPATEAIALKTLGASQANDQLIKPPFEKPQENVLFGSKSYSPCKKIAKLDKKPISSTDVIF